MSNSWLWHRLHDRIGSLVEDYAGVAGVCVKDLNSGQRIAVRGDEEFPTASTIKIHVLTRLLIRVEKGELDLDQMIHLTPQQFVPGSGIITYLEGPLSFSLLDIAILMIVLSDNTATNLCIDLAGIDETNAMLRELGMKQTTLRRKMQDMASVARNHENIATPAECVDMLELLYQGKPSTFVSERCLSILKKPKNGSLNKALPATIPLANKPGGMERVRCDAGVVYLPRRPYAIAVMTKFGLAEPLALERIIIDVARLVHETMVALDTSSDYGQGIPNQV